MESLAIMLIIIIIIITDSFNLANLFVNNTQCASIHHSQKNTHIHKIYTRKTWSS